MNTILDTTGAILYIVFCIVLFPLFLLTDCILWSMIAYRYVKAYNRRLVRMRAKKKEVIYHFPLPFDRNALAKKILLLRTRL